MTRPADAPEWMRDKDFEIDLGDGHWASFYQVGPGKLVDGSEIPYVPRAGAIVTHRQPKSPTGWCQGAVSFNGRDPDVSGGRGWDLHSEDPLDVSPSLLCKAQLEESDGLKIECNDHGFIREGRWVRA